MQESAEPGTHVYVLNECDGGMMLGVSSVTPFFSSSLFSSLMLKQVKIRNVHSVCVQ